MSSDFFAPVLGLYFSFSYLWFKIHYNSGSCLTSKFLNNVLLKRLENLNSGHEVIVVGLLNQLFTRRNFSEIATYMTKAAILKQIVGFSC